MSMTMEAFATHKLAELAPRITHCVEKLNGVIDSAGNNLSRRASKIGHLLNRAANMRIETTICGKLTSYIGIGTGTHAKDKVSDQTRMGQEAFTTLIRYAKHRGIRFIDTADSYGTHQMLAVALDGQLKGRVREDYCIQTKTMATTAAGVRADAERFCAELQTNYLDHLLLHCVETPDWPDRLRDASDELMRLKADGLVRRIGVSIHGLEALSSARSCDWPDVCLVRINHDGAKLDAEPDVVIDALREMRQRGRTLIGMKVFGAGRFDSTTCKKSLRWVRNLELCSAVVLGLTTPDQIDEAFAVA